MRTLLCLKCEKKRDLLVYEETTVPTLLAILFPEVNDFPASEAA